MHDYLLCRIRGAYTRSLSKFAKIGPKLGRGLIHEGGLYTPKYGNKMNLNYFGCKDNSFFDFEKVEKLSGDFREILGNFSKKIAGHKTPNFENFRKFFLKTAIIH